MQKIKTNILVVDDEADIRESLKDILSDEGHDVFLAKNATIAISLKEKEKIDLILLDIWMPDTDGISLLKQWVKNKELDCPVLMMSGHGTIDTAIEATKIGATDFLEKPISMQKLLKSVSSALKNSFSIDKLDKDFLENNNTKFVIDFKDNLLKLKNLNFVYLVGDKGNFFDICIHYLINTNYFTVNSSNIINESFVKAMEEKGIKFLLVNDYIKFPLEKKNLFCSLVNKIKHAKIKVIFNDPEIADKDIQFLDSIDKNLVNNIIKMPDLIINKDLIPDLANSILDFYLVKNNNFKFKEFDISALNLLRVNQEIINIDLLDKIILNIMIRSDSEKITSADVETYFNSKKVNETLEPEADPFKNLFNMPLRDARDNFEKMYFNFHLIKKISVAELAKKTGIERTHLYRKLKQLKIKD